jgi:hypothetical protein
MQGCARRAAVIGQLSPAGSPPWVMCALVITCSHPLPSPPLPARAHAATPSWLSPQHLAAASRAAGAGLLRAMMAAEPTAPGDATATVPLVSAAPKAQWLRLADDVKLPQLGAVPLFIRYFYDGCIKGVMSDLDAAGTAAYRRFIVLGNPGSECRAVTSPHTRTHRGTRGLVSAECRHLCTHTPPHLTKHPPRASSVLLAPPLQSASPRLAWCSCTARCTSGQHAA